MKQQARDSRPGGDDAVLPLPLASARRARYLALLAVLLGALLLAGNFASWLLYLSVRDEMDAQLGERLLSIATTAAQTIGSDRFQTLVTQGSSAPEHPIVRAELERIAAYNDLDNLILVDGERRTVLDLRGDATLGARHPLLDLQPELWTTLVSGVPQTTRLVKVEGLASEYLKTGFAPLEDSEGRILGAIAVEGGSGFFSVLPAMRSKLFWTAGGGLAAILVLAFFAFRILRSLIRLEDSLRRTAALAAIGQISAIVAHEIKNPLAIIRSRAERVRSKIAAGKDREEVLSWFEAIPGEVDRLNEILTNYLSLARPDQLGEGHCQVAQVAEETLTLLEPELRKRGIRVERAFEARGGQVAMGGRSLKQVLLNLLLNSIQAMEAGGAIRMRTRRAARGIELEVEDTGPGMKEEERQRVFEPFFTTKATGSGLGLTLVSSLVQARGGRLEIASAPGRGTRVKIWLPPGEEKSDGE